MSRIYLTANSVLAQLPSEGEKYILWQSQTDKDNFISLEREMEERLVKIRKLHAHWAYKTGFLKKGNRSFENLLEGGEKPSMWWTSLIYERHPKLSPNLFFIYKLICLEELLTENNCTELIVYGCDKNIRQAIRQICDCYKFSLIFADKAEKKDSKFTLKSCYFALPPFLRTLIRLIHWCFNIWRKIYFARKPDIFNKSINFAAQNNITTGVIVTYFPNIDLALAGQGRFISRYWEKLHELLNMKAAQENPGGHHFVRWLFIRYPAPGLTLEQCLVLKDIFNQKGRDGLSFNYLEDFIYFKDIGLATLRWLKISFKSIFLKKFFAQNCKFASHVFNFWPFMKEQWAESFQGWKCLERSLQNRGFKNYIKEIGTQRWILYPLENCPWERMLVLAARSSNPRQPVYGSQHSIIRPTDFRYFDDPETFTDSLCKNFQPFILGTNGKNGYDQLLSNGLPINNLMLLEALRYLYLAKYDINRKEKNPLPPQPGIPVVENGFKSILIVTSFFKDETDHHLNLLGECIREGIFEDWQITIKPHPYLPVTNWIKTQKKKIRVAEGPLELAFNAGRIVWASNSTTACLDAVLRGKAVMVMRAFGDFDLCPLQNLQQLWRTGNLQEVKEGLSQIKPFTLPENYLDLNNELPAWKKLLKI